MCLVDRAMLCGVPVSRATPMRPAESRRIAPLMSRSDSGPTFTGTMVDGRFPARQPGAWASALPSRDSSPSRTEGS
jgi:hypothetical protein